MIRRARLAFGTFALCGVLAACGGGGSSPSAAPAPRTPPDLQAFLRLPVATPSACPRDQNGTTVNRVSPWVGHVDVSVFLRPSASRRATATVGRQLRQSPLVQTAYFESRAQAYREFQRLYTCWTRVDRSQTPASYRLVLLPTVTTRQRNDFVVRLLHRPDIDSVTCDPSAPCVDVVRSAQAGR
ncbi:MAG TPA: permease-like cell division protein FtsX [Mycobacteriales bacterium]|nr:permease-like cell division protein FtsX [Mycobacteriales bacterium]